MTEKAALFAELTAAVEEILAREDTRDARLQAVCDLLHDRVPRYDWVGFYLVPPGEPGQLRLGPYAGAATEHTHIAFGQGVCGQAAARAETVNVPDVRAEGNYLACSLETRSEIVVPLLRDGEVLGELDLDSHTRDAFQPADREFLESLAARISVLF